MINVSWQEEAACKGADINLFFPAERGSKSYYQYEEIEKYCASCPVQEECLQFALDNFIYNGIWGGKSANQRRMIAKQMRNISLRSA